MKGFLEEYGLIIVVVAVILILLLLGTTVGEEIKTNIMATVTNLFDKANNANGKYPIVPGDTILSMFRVWF